MNETLQHWILAGSFIILVVSGFSLRYSESWWVQVLFGWGGGEGFLIRGIVHRVAAIVMVISSVWHLAYLCTGRGRSFVKDMLPSFQDLAHAKTQVLYCLGASRDKPQFRRFSYMEKIEYWALAWGTLIMTVSGVLLAFDDYFVARWGVPKGLLDVMLVIHFYEAWLATLAILVWHGYSTVFSPHVYPMNPAWLSGKMPKDMYTHEHPDGPRLKAFVHRRLFEEEESEGDEPGQAGNILVTREVPRSRSTPRPVTPLSTARERDA